MAEKITLHLAEKFRPEAQEIVTGRTCVIAQSGAGKSYLIAVICEKLLENNAPFCIIDTEGEYFSLKEKFQLLWAGGSEADVNIEEIDLKELAEKAVKENVSVILDVSDVVDEKKTVAEFVSALYEAETRLRTPYLLIIEEADKFAPQAVGKDQPTAAVLKIIEEVSRRGRKRGLGMLVASQRPALINKNVLSQCGNQLIGKLTTENDLAAVNLFFAGRKELDELPKLNQGEFFAMGNIAREKVKFRSYPRQTKHKGLTPELIPKAAGKISVLKSEVEHTKPNAVESILAKHENPPESKKVKGIPPVITREEASKTVEKRRKKKFGPFGDEERLVSFGMEWEPVAYVEAFLYAGLLKQKKKISFFLNCSNGTVVETNNGYRILDSASELLSRSENECKVLLAMGNKYSNITIAELAQKTGLSESALREITEKLRRERKITWSKDKNVNYYEFVTLIKAPNFDRSAQYAAQEVEAHGIFQEQKFGEKDVRNVLKATDKKAEITDFKLFYYPLWHAQLRGKTASRPISIDAVTGKEV